MEVAHNALLDFTTGQPFTILAVRRQWELGNISTAAILGKKETFSTVSHAGYSMVGAAGASDSRARMRLSDGTTQTSHDTESQAAGVLYSTWMRYDGTNFSAGLNTALGSSSSAVIAPSQIQVALRIGRIGGNYGDTEIIAVSVFRRALTSTEISQITAYYQARLS